MFRKFYIQRKLLTGKKLFYAGLKSFMPLLLNNLNSLDFSHFHIIYILEAYN